MIEYHVTRNFGHPWNTKGRPGFDLLEVTSADTEAELDDFIKKAELNFWQVWISGEFINEEQGSMGIGAVLYKPCDIDKEWNDDPKNPHPGHVRRV